MNTGEIAIYQAARGAVRLEVRLERDTVWLTQAQMTQLFGRDQSVVSRHIRSVFKEKELDEKSNMQKMHNAFSDKPVITYSLDTIISVGYRVKSKQGTQFRVWATQTLRDHLLRGYTLNEKRLREKGFTEIEQAVELLSRTLANQSLVTEQGRAVLDVVQKYTRAWRLLLEYDEDRLSAAPTRAVEPTETITLGQARAIITRLKTSLAARGETSDLFGRERGNQLHGLLGAIEQTFDGELLYPTAQARAAHILYFVIKDHPFSDGNKRIGTLLFLEYLRCNGLLLRDGALRLTDTAIVALALLIAESDPKHKDLMIRLTLNLLEDH
ncbi:MAG: virulence RhuM family protein [Candidatus Obscuribacterales bacterium]|nr:virulence RhuM family protein [Steroidobacteraceae bacterium]